MKPLSSDYYDSVRQREIWWSAPTDLNKDLQREALRARLRFDYLFSPSITLGRADVLDGACFMHTSPSEIRRWLGLEEEDSPPIAVLTRSGRLDEDLLDWVRPAHTGTLDPELFFVVDPRLRQVLSAGLPRALPNTINDWKNLPKAIGEVLGKDIEQQLYHFWNAWITEAPQNFMVSRFPKAPTYDPYIPHTLSSEDLAPYGIEERSLQGEQTAILYRQAALTFRAGNWSRAILTRWLERELPNVDPFVAEVVKQRINIGIGRARSLANNTDHEVISSLDLRESWLQRNASWLLTGDLLTEGMPGLVEVELPSYIGLWLVDCDYEALLRKVRLFRRRWLISGSLDDLRRFAESIADAMVASPSSLPIKPSPVLVRCLRIVTITGGAVTAVYSVISGSPWSQALLGLGTWVYGTLSSDFELSRMVKSVERLRFANQLVQTIRSRM